MQYQELGSTGIRVSKVAFGAGPISGLMVGDALQQQQKTVQRAIELGINWFDTAATYGGGQSETSLGIALRSTGAAAAKVHVATKVRLAAEQLSDIRRGILESFTGSLERLGLERVTLLQLHNSVTRSRGDLPTSLTTDDVLGQRGVLETFEELRSQGLVDHFGFTGLGDMYSLDKLITDGSFSTVQVPYNILRIFTEDRSAGSVDVDYEQVLKLCQQHQVASLAIRIFAGGALTGQPPSAHTFKTKFFPLELFQKDQIRADRIVSRLPEAMSLKEASVRFVSSHPAVSTMLVGFASPEQVDEVVQLAQAGPLDSNLLSGL